MRTLGLVLATVVVALNTATASARPTVRVISSAYGRILADGTGHALYLFTADSRRASHCYSACARAWPPLYSRGESLRAGSGLSSAKIATIKRRGGRRQVTYNGHPLYYYVGDKRPGDVFCQDVFEFGGRWLVLDRHGNAVR